MDKVKLRIEGVAPLLMHSCIGINPMHPITQEIKKITSKRKKTEDDFLRLSQLEYKVSMYYDSDPKIGPYVPAMNIDAVIRDGAKKIRKGKDAQSSIFTSPDFIPLIYDGPRDIDELYKDPRFQDVRKVNVQRSSVLRCRPRFEHWALECEVMYDETVIDRDELVQSLDYAGRLIGLCDYRPRYGRFVATIL